MGDKIITGINQNTYLILLPNHLSQKKNINIRLPKQTQGRHTIYIDESGTASLKDKEKRGSRTCQLPICLHYTILDKRKARGIYLLNILYYLH